ncbi:hypothetical protein BGZ73_006068 [Actinomortierella ambigua]|nr:hypothetical protein BGZ73_006068 [Actinomortierella ambigua]
MGSSASKLSSSTTKAANAAAAASAAAAAARAAAAAPSSATGGARHFPSAKVVQDKAATAARETREKQSLREIADEEERREHGESTARYSDASPTDTSSPVDYAPKKDGQLLDDLERYSEALKDAQKKLGQDYDGSKRPLEDRPDTRYFGNLQRIGQVDVDNPDYIKHRQAQEILKRKLPSKSTSSGINETSTLANAATHTGVAPVPSSGSLTPLKLMQLLQLRNKDPSLWTEEALQREFHLQRDDLRVITRYINTYTILPGKDAKGRETGVWCEDLRGVEVSTAKEELEKERRQQAGQSKEKPRTLDRSTRRY